MPTANGPGMIQFRPDGRYAFEPSSFTPELDVIDVARHEVVARVEQASPFSPNLAVSPDGKEVWFTLKDIGKAQVTPSPASNGALRHPRTRASRVAFRHTRTRAALI